MQNEIERKFFVNEMPDLSGIQPKRYERYILEDDAAREVRISRIDGECVREEKSEVAALERIRSKKSISAEEFDALKSSALGGIIRDKYVLHGSPEVALQVYHGRFEGLVRAEVEFESEADAKAYQPPSWMGNEMTGLPISRDARLISLTAEEFQRLLKS